MGKSFILSSLVSFSSLQFVLMRWHCNSSSPMIFWLSCFSDSCCSLVSFLRFSAYSSLRLLFCLPCTVSWGVSSVDSMKEKSLL